jgi:hypothetical protein
MSDRDREAPTSADYYAGLCALAEARGRVPDLVYVAKAFGLPPPDRGALERFHDDVVSGRIPGGTPAAEVRERYYIAQAAGRSGTWGSPSERSTLDWATTPSAPPVATPSRNGDAPAWFITEPAPRAEDDDLDDHP